MNMSDFICNLLINVYEGIIAGEVRNQNAIEEFRKSITLDDEEFAKLYVSESEVRNDILIKFPVKNNTKQSSVDPGMEYIRGNNPEDEKPQIKKISGYEMTSGDYEFSINKFVITNLGYKHIYDEILATIIVGKKYVFSQVIKIGIPRVLVGNGKVSAKVLINPLNDNNNCQKKSLKKGIYYSCFDECNELINCGLADDYKLNGVNLKIAKEIWIEGYFNWDKEGEYIIYMSAKKPTIIFINDEFVIKTNSTVRPSKKTYIKKGLNKIKIRYLNSYSEELIKVCIKFRDCSGVIDLDLLSLMIQVEECDNITNKINLDIRALSAECYIREGGKQELSLIEIDYNIKNEI